MGQKYIQLQGEIKVIINYCLSEVSQLSSRAVVGFSVKKVLEIATAFK